MTFSKFSALALLALSVILAGCASSAPKKDPYAQAAATKRTEIDRLSRRIDSLRVLPVTDEIDRQLDSLRVRRSLETGNLQGIGQAVEETRKLREEEAIRSPAIRIYRDSASNKKYRIN